MSPEEISLRIHEMEEQEALDLLETDLVNGLAADEARHRLARYGPNEITRRRGPRAWIRFMRQFRQPLVYILLLATVVVIGLGQWVDASVILGIVLVNAVIGFIQEDRAEKAIAALSQMVPAKTSLRRDGKTRCVDTRDVVPGDLVLLQAGDRVPADLRLVRVKELRVDESMLTGESVPVAKQAGRLPVASILAERRNVAYAGTLVVAGQAEGAVWATGDRTESGRIAGLLSAADSLVTPLTRKIATFSRLMLRVILALAAVTFTIGVLRGETVVDMFMAAVALAVGAIPEGLPATVTIVLAAGVSRLARRGTIVRRLPAVETLGSTTVICSDKTGTLTENQMTVREIFAAGRSFELAGNGYDPAGAVYFDGSTVLAGSEPALTECLRAGLLCNDAELLQKEGRWVIHGDPTEAALIVAARKGGLDGPLITASQPRLDSLPFESARQYMATLHRDGGTGRRVIYKKGAVEHLLPKCIDALDAVGEHAGFDRSMATRAAERMAAKGLRVLAFASRAMPQEHNGISHQHVAGSLTFLGLQGMEDPPREDAIRAISRCKDAGIKVKMITGDHVLTARSIAVRLGIGDDMPSALTGRQLEDIPDHLLPGIAESAPVFARVSPEQKVRLVKALQARGHIVAMTGDGVNDAPALRQADIGVAMGVTGTDVAKGAADIILTDDNFTSIESAVEEGRGAFDNLVKCIVWEIPCNFGEALTLLAAIFLGMTLPALPVQLLWVNMMTAVILGFALVFEPKEDDLMSRQPRDPTRPIMDFPLFMRTCLVSLVILAGCFGLFLWEQSSRGLSMAEARTVVVNVIVVVEAFYLLSCRSLIRSPWAVGFFSNPWVLPCIAAMMGLQVAFTYLPWMNCLFGSAPLDAVSWLHVILVGASTFLLVEFEKWLRRRYAPPDRGWQGSAKIVSVPPSPAS